GGLAYGFINVLLFLHFQPWSTLDGVLNWGDNLFGRFGIGIDGALSPLLRSGSVINIGLIMGAFLAALLAGQFGIRVGPGRELIKGLGGGLLMGVGAVLVRGCNIGGFFSGTSSLGLHGVTMALGLAFGAFLGVRYLMWEMEHASATGANSKSWLHNARIQPYVGGVILIALLAGAISYARQGYNSLSVILLFGILLGVVSQRSRVCFVAAFRDPFLTGKGSHTKAMLLGLVVSMIGIALVKYVAFDNLDDTVVYAFVRPTFWLGSL
ncbi:MAG: YeeE/YedE family protein, partial [Phycisphaerae bacterium]|nr:YeeE/YedE family protein [Phycisphaerae bacterium]NIR63951.1 YeeE/YedE family protein [candidate division Zixibacteria bacterium]NIP51152.1 YeeE/YedE family protein [Phycisphaerae bacterium]NIU14007.1 YeeE/YedE family protein [candidate division Zixibacteria bacterium]NIV00654.1 YeeE/YedE family protein [Phycisphaerae bacterium]